MNFEEAKKQIAMGVHEIELMPGVRPSVAQIFQALVDEIDRLRHRVKSLEDAGAFPPGWMPPGR